MPLNRVSFYGKHYATGFPFLIELCDRGYLQIIRKLCDRVIMWKGIFGSSLEGMDFGTIFTRQGILLGDILCDRVQDVERFATNPRHFPGQVSPGRCVGRAIVGCSLLCFGE